MTGMISVEFHGIMNSDEAGGEKTQVNDDFTVFLNFLLQRSFSILFFCYSTQISNFVDSFYHAGIWIN